MDVKELTKAMMIGSFDKGTIMRRIGVARQYLEQVYFTPNRTPFAEWATKAGVHTVDIDVLSILDGPFWDSFTRETMYALLEEIRTTIGGLPTIGLYVPCKPEPVEEFKYGSWLREHINPDIVMDVHVDSSMVGGCAITAGGMWRDYSVRYFMRKKREDILGIIDRYAEGEKTEIKDE